MHFARTSAERPARAQAAEPRSAPRRAGGVSPRRRPRLFVRSPSREPILVPKVRICFADFPCLHSLVCKGRPERTGRRSEGRHFSIRGSAFVWRPYQEKIALPGVPVRSLRGRLRCRLAGSHSARPPTREASSEAGRVSAARQISASRPGNRRPNPFRSAADPLASAPRFDAFALPSGAARPQSIDVRVEPCSASAVEGFA